MNSKRIAPGINTFEYQEFTPEQKGHGSVIIQERGPARILDHLNSQLEQLSRLIGFYNRFKFHDKASQLDCICALMEQVISEKQQELLIETIHQTGYERIQKAFIALNQVCEDIFREKEDLFGILKRHRLNYPVPDNDSLKLYRISQFMNVTLIHFHMQKKRGFRLTDLQQKIKKESAIALAPLLEKLIHVMQEAIPFRHSIS
jgi:hypothetical protein